MKRIIRLIVLGAITLVVIKTSTFGWKIFSGSTMRHTPHEKELAERLKEHVFKLSHEIGNRDVINDYAHLERAADYIVEQFQQYDFQVQFQYYSVENKKVRNIIATKKGRRSPDEIIIVGAHYDSCLNPGADDNASGIAGLLELARYIADKEINYTVCFVAFVNEEPPFFTTELMGSRVYVRELKAGNKKVKGVLILEMLGYYAQRFGSQRYPPFFGIFHPPWGNFIAVVSNFASGGLARKIESTFKKYARFPIETAITFGSLPGIYFSDHWSFWKEGYPAVMITDTSYLRNNNYHSSTDTYKTLDYESMAMVVEGFDSVLFELIQ